MLLNFERGPMRSRIVLAVVYAITVIPLFDYFDGLYGGEPIHGDMTLIHTATAGAILFAIAFLASLLALRVGLVCGFAACILSWPFWGFHLIMFIWMAAGGALHHDWEEALASLVLLILSTVYTVVQLQLWFRASKKTPR